MGSPEISFSRMLDNDFGEPAEAAETMERSAPTQPSQTPAPESMHVDEGASCVYVRPPALLMRRSVAQPAPQKKKKKAITPDEVKRMSRSSI